LSGEREYFHPTIGFESLHLNNNDNDVRILNFGTSKNLVVKNHNQIDHILIDRRWHSSIPDVQIFRGATVILITIFCLQHLGKALQ